MARPPPLPKSLSAVSSPIPSRPGRPTANPGQADEDTGQWSDSKKGSGTGLCGLGLGDQGGHGDAHFLGALGASESPPSDDTTYTTVSKDCACPTGLGVGPDPAQGLWEGGPALPALLRGPQGPRSSLTNSPVTPLPH